VLPRLSAKLRAHSAPETHAAVIELATGVHAAVTPAVAELAALRLALASELDEMGLTAASAGMYPLQSPAETRVSGSERYRRLVDSMRSLARREPTLALHVHIGIPDPEEAVRLLNGLRPALPILIALAANSPFSEGRDTGFASARTVTFHAFPRTGIARRFAGYRDYVRAVDPLLDSGALPDPSFLWWDVRLQPALGTVEIRVMDAQVAVADTAALVALVTSLARSILEGGRHDPEVPPEVLSENRFLAARDGLDAHLIDSERKRLVPARRLLDALLERCSRHADEIGSIELARVARLATANGAERQRAWTRAGGLDQLPRMLSQRFASVQAPAIPR
jgi:carboxylate-amine ligase